MSRTQTTDRKLGLCSLLPRKSFVVVIVDAVAYLDVSVRHLLWAVRSLSRCGYNCCHFPAVSLETSRNAVSPRECRIWCNGQVTAERLKIGIITIQFEVEHCSYES